MANARRDAHATGMAGEFFVLSALHRLGMQATMTLGSAKSVDIVVVKGPGRALTIDVKAVAGKDDWFAKPLEPSRPDHFFAFVSFDGKIREIGACPSVWIVPNDQLVAPLLGKWKGRNGPVFGVQRRVLRETGAEYFNSWALLTE